MVQDGNGDFEILEHEVRHDGFLRLEKYRLRHQLFAGGMSPVISRELLERGTSAAVLLYDPDLDRVVLLEQFRIGALRRPGGPWLMEIVAGVIEPGESPEAVVRREAVEEAGCEVHELEFIADYLVSPGGTSERVALYCGRVDASDAGGIHGLDSETEDIRVSTAGFDEAFAMIGDGRIDSAAPIMALQWLALKRDAVRKKWCRE